MSFQLFTNPLPRMIGTLSTASRTPSRIDGDAVERVPTCSPQRHAIWRWALNCAVLITVLACVGCGHLGGSKSIGHEKRVLVFSKTLGYRHASITNGIATIQQLGSEHGFAVEATEDSSAFTATNLARFRAVVFLSATGDILNPEQEAAFRDYVLGGGGLAAIHGAVFGPNACEDKWTWYGDAFGCAFSNHSAVLPAQVLIEDANEPSTRGLPARWSRTDEWYNFTGTPRGQAHVLATVDESTYRGGAMGEDHPIAWSRRIGKGRMWYTAMGHTESSFSEPLFLKHILGGIQTAAGWKAADFSANRKP